ncbi:MAG: hypothetical protein Q9218_001582 [Villophora microphyllina]
MWPIGYILDSPYSPLRLERDSESPNVHWRDAFEDLLALQSGRPMVREASRKAENLFAARRRFEDTSYFIAMTNTQLHNGNIIRERYKKLYQEAMQRKDDQNAENAQRIVAALERDQELNVAGAQDRQAEFERARDMTASSQMPRGQWMASLMNSGALPSWNWLARNSPIGPVMGFSKMDTSPASEVSFSELELRQIFEEGRPFGFGTPPELDSTLVMGLINGDDAPPWVAVPNHPFEDFKPSGSSVMAQAARPKTVKLPEGSLGTKVIITTLFADGRHVQKEFVQDAGGLLEEIENARKSMEFVIERIVSMSSSGSVARIQQMAQEIKEQDERESLGV